MVVFEFFMGFVQTFGSGNPTKDSFFSIAWSLLLCGPRKFFTFSLLVIEHQEFFIFQRRLIALFRGVCIVFQRNIALVERKVTEVTN